MDAKSDFEGSFPPVEEWDQNIKASRLYNMKTHVLWQLQNLIVRAVIHFN